RWFLSRTLYEQPYRAIALVVFDSNCPLARRLVPTLNELQDRIYQEKWDVLLLGAFVDPEESIQSIQEYGLKNNVRFPLVLLKGGSSGLGETLGALGLDRLSAGIVLGANEEILYRGRVSDEVRLTGFVP